MSELYNRLDDIQRIDVINWLRSYGQASIEENKDNCQTLARRATKALKFTVTRANIKKILPRINLQQSQAALSKYSRSLSGGKPPAKSVGANTDKLVQAVDNLVSVLMEVGVVLAAQNALLTDILAESRKKAVIPDLTPDLKSIG